MGKEEAAFSDFGKLDLRVGLVIEAQKVEGSKNLIRLKVDLGSEYGTKKIMAGLAGRYKPRDLKDKKFIFVANLAPKQMMKELSSGMILCADTGSEVMLVKADKKIPAGAIIR